MDQVLKKLQRTVVQFNCGCIRIVVYRYIICGGEKWEETFCVLHGGELPFLGTNEEFLERKYNILRTRNDGLRRQIRMKNGLKQETQDLLLGLEKGIVRLETENVELRKQLTIT